MTTLPLMSDASPSYHKSMFLLASQMYSEQIVQTMAAGGSGLEYGISEVSNHLLDFFFLFLMLILPQSYTISTQHRFFFCLFPYLRCTTLSNKVNRLESSIISPLIFLMLCFIPLSFIDH